jgi:hypothetical protein
LQAIYHAANSFGRSGLRHHPRTGRKRLVTDALREAQISNLPNIHVIPGDVPVGSVGRSAH